MLGVVQASGPGNTAAILKAGRQSVDSLVKARQLAIRMVRTAQGAPRLRQQEGGALSAPPVAAMGRQLDRHA